MATKYDVISPGSVKLEYPDFWSSVNEVAGKWLDPEFLNQLSQQKEEEKRYYSEKGEEKRRYKEERGIEDVLREQEQRRYKAEQSIEAATRGEEKKRYYEERGIEDVLREQEEQRFKAAKTIEAATRKEEQRRYDIESLKEQSRYNEEQRIAKEAREEEERRYEKKESIEKANREEEQRRYDEQQRIAEEDKDEASWKDERDMLVKSDPANAAWLYQEGLEKGYVTDAQAKTAHETSIQHTEYRDAIGEFSAAQSPQDVIDTYANVQANRPSSELGKQNPEWMRKVERAKTQLEYKNLIEGYKGMYPEVFGDDKLSRQVQQSLSQAGEQGVNAANQLIKTNENFKKMTWEAKNSLAQSLISAGADAGVDVTPEQTQAYANMRALGLQISQEIGVLSPPPKAKLPGTKAEYERQQKSYKESQKVLRPEEGEPNVLDDDAVEVDGEIMSGADYKYDYGRQAITPDAKVKIVDKNIPKKKSPAEYKTFHGKKAYTGDGSEYEIKTVLTKPSKIEMKQAQKGVPIGAYPIPIVAGLDYPKVVVKDKSGKEVSYTRREFNKKFSLINPTAKVPKAPITAPKFQEAVDYAYSVGWRDEGLSAKEMEDIRKKVASKFPEFEKQYLGK